MSQHIRDIMEMALPGIANINLLAIRKDYKKGP